jgi:hypothetical protein
LRDSKSGEGSPRENEQVTGEIMYLAVSGVLLFNWTNSYRCPVSLL